jgi:hypothetical protein
LCVLLAAGARITQRIAACAPLVAQIGVVGGGREPCRLTSYGAAGNVANLSG